MRIWTGKLPEIHGGAGARLRLALFGWHTRYVLGVYLQHLFIVGGGLLIAALSIDASTQISNIVAAPPHVFGFDIIGRLAWYLLLRSADIGTKLMPVCCFLGALSAEVALALARERLVIWSSGRTPFQCVLPALILGLVLGGPLFGLDAYVRPMAMSAQAAGRLGEDGERYDRSPNSYRYWLAAGDKIVNARLVFGPPTGLRNLTLYRLSGDGHLVQVIGARSATPSPDSKEWVLEGGNQWDADQPSLSDDRPPITTIDLGFDALWLRYFGINPMYLSQESLKALARANSGGLNGSEYRMHLYLRYADWVLPAGMILLASSLALALLPYRVSFERVLVIALAGYSTHVLLRALALLGGQGSVSPALSAFLVPTLIFATVLGVLITTYLAGTGRMMRWKRMVSAH